MIYDISPPINPALKVWPGDTPPTREILLDMRRGATITLSTLHATVHLGAHADGPNHYGLGTPGIETRPLDDYLGPCQVIAINAAPSGLIASGDLPCPITAERVLIRTGTYPDPAHFSQDFAGLDAELVAFLHDRGVKLIGIDTPSVDPFDSQDLPAHRAFLRYDMSILEGLVLNHVPDGLYELIALPLPLVGFDASPVRAILRTLP
jgi:arylformamidase